MKTLKDLTTILSLLRKSDIQGTCIYQNGDECSLKYQENYNGCQCYGFCSDYEVGTWDADTLLIEFIGDVK